MINSINSTGENHADNNGLTGVRADQPQSKRDLTRQKTTKRLWIAKNGPTNRASAVHLNNAAPSAIRPQVYDRWAWARDTQTMVANIFRSIRGELDLEM